MPLADRFFQPPLPVLLAALAGWVVLAATSGGGGPQAWLLLGAAGAYLIARILPPAVHWAPPLGVVAVAVVVFARDPDGSLTAQPIQGPFGYANAKAQFFALAALAAGMLWAALRPRLLRALSLMAAVAFASIPFFAHSWAAATLVVALGIAVLVSRTPGLRRAAVIAMAAVFAVAVVATGAIGAIYPNRADLIERTVGERRAQLWHDAIEQIADEPASGVGPGRFRLESPTALSDQDAQWAHHGFLQVAAETGIFGGILLTAVFGWALVALAFRPDLDRVAVAGAAAVASLGIHATVDYVLHFAALPIAAAALAGVALAARPSARIQ